MTDDDPSRAVDPPTALPAVPDGTRAMDGSVVSDRCPICRRPDRLTLETDWRDHPQRIAIIGCGNPWHYVDLSQRGIETPTDVEREREWSDMLEPDQVGREL